MGKKISSSGTESRLILVGLSLFPLVIAFLWCVLVFWMPYAVVIGAMITLFILIGLIPYLTDYDLYVMEGAIVARRFGVSHTVCKVTEQFTLNTSGPLSMLGFHAIKVNGRKYRFFYPLRGIRLFLTPAKLEEEIREAIRIAAS